MKRSVFLLVLTWALLFSAVAFSAVEINSHSFGEIKARSIGPAVMSGRITDIEVVHKNVNIIYVGGANGGVWKSIDGGNSFRPVFDSHVMSVGCITLDQKHPDTLWVGTGECNTRNSISIGAGVFKSTDGGQNWTCCGLENTEHISDILIDPRDPNVVYVGALGHLWNSNEDRGVYKTTDGGKTWEKILYVDASTGCADLAMDPQEQDIVYAAMWEVRRWPYFFKSGGPGSGLFRTRDAGKNWTKLTQDLPVGDLGRIAVEVAPSRSSVVYASVEAADKQTALFRSDNFGDSWTKVNTSSTVNYRPFYFSLLLADPKDYNRIYKTAYLLQASTDGGKSFRALGNAVHPDFQAFWINPHNTSHMMCGTDGGVYVSMDQGETWRFLRSLPLSQFYHVTVDMQKPYYVYGGLQDNGSWFGPSQSPDGVENKDWRNVGGGDGFAVVPDINDPGIIYAESQGGNINRVHIHRNESQTIKPEPQTGEPEFRFNWNTPIVASPNDPKGLYIGCQFLFYTTDGGLSWERLSPDLTTNDPLKQRQKESGGVTIDNTSAENHCTIYTISESPINPDIIWVGTDDGNVQVTRDRGKTWTHVVKNVPGLPACTWCSGVEAGHFGEGTAYATFDGHRTGDMATHVYKTTDFGQTWTSLVKESIKGYAHVIREDLVNPNLLFLGTEFGLYVSVDGGEQWAQFTGNLPGVAVMDMVIHPRDVDLVLATHGRGIYIVDDITPLRNLTTDALESDVAFLKTKPIVSKGFLFSQSWTGNDEFVGQNPTDAAQITYYMKKRHVFGDMKLEIYNSEGKLIKTLPGGKRAGINRVEWAMRLPPPQVPKSRVLAGGAMIGPTVPAGTYTLKLIKGKEEYTSTIDVMQDPDSPHSPEDLKLREDTVWMLYNMQENLAYISESLVHARDAAKELAGKLGEKDRVRKSLEAFADKADAINNTIIATEINQAVDDIKLREKIVGVYFGVIRYNGRPTQNQIDRAGTLQKEIESKEKEADAFFEKGLPLINTAIKKKNLDEIVRLTKEAWESKKE